LQKFAVIDGWSPRCWLKYKVSGEQRLYYAKHGNGAIYRAWNSYEDEGATATTGTAITGTFEGREEDLGHPMVYKCGGELEIESLAAGSDNTLSVYVSIDGEGYQLLGTVDLDNEDAPTLPVSLPFSLADSFRVREKFHLDSLGRWKTIQVKIVNSDENTDKITVYGYNIVSFLEEYENE
jgi:hypothetical protein